MDTIVYICPFENAKCISGWTSISADEETILWSIGYPVYASRLVYTRDLGKTWGKI